MGVFTNAISLVAGGAVPHRERDGSRGLAGRLLERQHRRAESKPRLTVAERVTVAPRQMLALIEADGERFLVATSPKGAPAFHRLRSPSLRRPRNQDQAGRDGGMIASLAFAAGPASARLLPDLMPDYIPRTLRRGPSCSPSP